MRFTQRLVAILACGLIVGGAGLAAPFHNTRNTPFEAACNGPQGAIVVQQRSGVRAAASADAVGAAIRAQHDAQHLRRAERALHFLQSRGIVSPRAELRFPRGIAHASGGRLLTPDLDRVRAQQGTLGDSANELRFAFEGFSAAEQTALEGYLDVAYPRARQVYGPPAFDLDVKIIQDDSLGEIQGGTYDAATNEIRIPPLSGNFPEDTFVLMMLVLRAFRDDAALHFDTWEQGMTRAAATAVQISPGVAPGYNPFDPGPFYAGSVYEAENQAPLGNSTFFADSGFTGMLVWRLAMSFAAWMKCWVDDPSFFGDFNQAYYAAHDAQLPGDSRRLQVLASDVLPSVEGMAFADWFRRQYVLDTSVTTGPKLYVWNIPLTEAVALIAEHYVTEFDGDEAPRGGRATTNYFNYDFTIDLFAEEGNTIDIPASGDGAGEGFLIPTFFNIGGPQRITVRVTLDDLVRDYPYPYNLRGFDPGENNFYGAIIGRLDGDLDVDGGTTFPDIDVSRGVWGVPLTAQALSAQQLVVSFTNLSGRTVTRTVNVLFDSYIMFLESGTESRIEHAFFRGSNGVNFIALPITPLPSDEADVFGIAPERLLLARYNPRRAGEQKYEFYPDIEPIRPGRGYFLKVFADANIDVLGLAPDASSTVEIPLEPGWNMIGDPFLTAVMETSLQVRRGTGTPVSMEAAANNGWIQAGLFRYRQASGYELTDRLAPFEGAWIRARLSSGVRLLVPGPGVATGASAARSVAEPDWKLPLVVRCGDLVSSCSYLGGSSRATDGVDPRFDLTAPPAWGRYVSLSFPGEPGADRVTDVRPAAADEEWRFEVRTSEADAEVEVSWPDLAGVPGHLRPILTDLDTGAQRYMRTTRRCRFHTTGADAPRHFSVKLGGGARPLVITSLGASEAAGATTLAYTLSAPARVSCTVRNIAGRPVRHLLTDRDVAAGTQEIAWSRHDDNGLRVPSGAYLVELEAEGPDGQSMRRTVAVRVQP